MFSEPVGRLTLQLRSFWAQISNGGVLAGGRAAERRRLTIRRPPGWIFWSVVCAAVAVAIIYEVETSSLQSRLFPYLVRRMTYSVEPGASARIVFPADGPFDLRRGYSRIAQFQERLEKEGFRVKEQARFSPYLEKLTLWGITPPYREAGIAGLVIRTPDGKILHDATAKEEQFENYDEIPPVIVKTLLLIENRQLSVESAYPTNNPVVEWNRLAKATLTYAGVKVGLPVRLEGGSTLATQLEKYLHSPQGRTESAGDKIRQIISASLKAYRDGSNTANARRKIIVDYLNSMPLAAAPGYGEVNGLGEGLSAWFGVDLDETCRILNSEEQTPAKAEAFKRVLLLLSSVRAPAYYLIQDRPALEARASYYANLLGEFGLVEPEFTDEVRNVSMTFPEVAPSLPPPFGPRQKLSATLRSDLAELTGVNDFYSLNQLDLEVRTSVDAGLQDQVDQLFSKLRDPEFLQRNGLYGERLLSPGNTGDVIYSMVLFESLPDANVLRVRTDSLDRALDINDGIKMELGSTAKLRTLAHYLETIASLYYQRHSLGKASDPITSFVQDTVKENPSIPLADLLQKAMDRSYSASPYEAFFTGGGIHTFGNFDPNDNGRRLTIREATRRSTNLVFIRLMRDLVRYHEARLWYDRDLILSDQNNPTRRRMLREIADREARLFLFHAFKRFEGRSPAEITQALLGSKARSPRQLAIVYLAWHGTSDPDLAGALASWLQSMHAEVRPGEVSRLLKAYGNPRLTLADYAYLLDRHPLDVWAAGELIRKPTTDWQGLWAKSAPACEVSSAWLFQPRNRRAQDLRLRIRIEQDAFARMTPYWKRLGFPFQQLIPSYATAIGNSSDRPAALAELLGIILNDGNLKPTLHFDELRFGAHTPYRTVVVPATLPSQRVMMPAIARVLRGVLADVVEGGTARRVSGVFVTRDGQPIPVGGKTGSGDNRYKSFSRGGGLVGSRAVNRTATFAFYIGDRYFGVITAAVLGPEAGHYHFTSALPVQLLKDLAPAILSRYETESF